MMGEIYDVRSAVEHLHENRYLESFDRQTRLDLLKKEAITEHMARSAIARIVGDSNLWPHFANTSSLREFWALEETKRRRIWGDPINQMDAIADFDPKYIHDGHLGESWTHAAAEDTPQSLTFHIAAYGAPGKTGVFLAGESPARARP
jgi:hypothetical protein